MALPKIERPASKITLPSADAKTGTIYPFTMKEQKVLLIAEQSGEIDDILKGITDTVKNCSTFDPMELTSAELQWVFLNIRKFSVGSNIDITLTCGHCDADPIGAKLSLDEFEFIKSDSKVDDKIMINDTLGIMLSEPTMSKLVDNPEDGGINSVIKFVFDEENTYNFSDYSDDEVNEFVESLPANVVEDIVEYTDSFSKLKLRKDWKCISCSESNEIDIEGISAFFG